MSSNWSRIDKIPLANMKFRCEQSPGVQGWTQMPIKNRPRHVQDLHMKASNVLWNNQWEMMILSNW
jgi:hypothetical protein